MMGLTRGFFYAGAERVLVSLWNVSDRPTVELMRSFYRGVLVEGLSPAEALRKAQDTIRRRSVAGSLLWAGFTLQGDWREILSDARPGLTGKQPRGPGRTTFRHQARESAS